MDTQTTGSTQSTRKTKEVPPHYDKLGVEIFPGDYVVAPDGNRQTMIAKVIRLNPKMLTICRIGSIYNSNTYASETVKLDSNLVTMYILRNKK